MIKKLHIALFFSLFAFILNAQNIRYWMKEGDQAFDEKNYYGAAMLYQKALEMNNMMGEIHFKLGNCHRELREYKEAEKYYGKAFRQDKERFPEARYWMGKMQKKQAKYDKAENSFRYFIKHANDKSGKFYSDAKYEQAVCEDLSNEKNNLAPFTIETLDEEINTEESEFAPMFFSDSLLYFYRFDKSTGTSTAFSTKILKNGEISAKADTVKGFEENNIVSHIQIIPETDKVLIQSSNGILENSLIYWANYRNNTASRFFSFDKEINKPNTNIIHPMTFNIFGETYLIYSADNEGGFGGYDLYIAKWEKMTFKNSINLGKTINTSGNEISPYFDTYDSLLYFSSDNHSGRGGYDIFKTKGWINKWESPKNMPEPINSNFDELYFSVNHAVNLACFTSNRENKDLGRTDVCCNDIYVFDIPGSKNDSIYIRLARQSLESQLEGLLPLTLFFDNDQPNPKSKDSITNESFNILLEEYLRRKDEYIDNYSYDSNSKNYEKKKAEIDNLFEDEIEWGYNRLKKALNKIHELLEMNVKIQLELKAYASPLNSEEYNKLLSKRRVSSLLNYFRNYHNGSLIPYLDNNLLSIQTIAFGESLSSEKVSDDIRDLQASVYSPAAARERKIQIIALKVEVLD